MGFVTRDLFKWETIKSASYGLLTYLGDVVTHSLSTAYFLGYFAQNEIFNVFFGVLPRGCIPKCLKIFCQQAKRLPGSSFPSLSQTALRGFKRLSHFRDMRSVFF